MYSRQLVHQWRSEEQAILVGANTVAHDNPSLTTRDVKGKNPIRIVIDIQNSLPKSSQVFNSEAKTITLTNNEIDSSIPLAKQICTALYLNNISSVIVEGGKKTLQTFIDEQLWDEARIFSSNENLKTGVRKPQLKGKLVNEIKIKSDTLKTMLND
jgi:diaminohydroxyphosphoribosylaminopyrimidine deaminase/5-amino-6-(5-phosphoribosylamino)uracil reductase